MRNTELTYLIRSAYDVGESDRKKDFIKKHPNRQLNYTRILFMQLQYMGIQVTALCAYALASLLFALSDFHEDLARLISIFMPAAALVALTGLGKSTRYGMDEIETSTRFSLRMIRIVRLAIIGIAAAIVMTAASCVIRVLSVKDPISAFSLAAIPYLVTTFLCMLLIRTWHSQKNIYGCVAVSVGVAIGMFGGIGFLERCSLASARLTLLVSFGISVVLTLAESYRYINESEVLQWN